MSCTKYIGCSLNESHYTVTLCTLVDHFNCPPFNNRHDSPVVFLGMRRQHGFDASQWRIRANICCTSHLSQGETAMSTGNDTSYPDIRLPVKCDGGAWKHTWLLFISSVENSHSHFISKLLQTPPFVSDPWTTTSQCSELPSIFQATSRCTKENPKK